jgi:uncharacterized SAM-binding protein YcdF (DUF218 family)
MYGVFESLIKPYPLLFFCIGWGLFLLWRRGDGSKRLRIFLSAAYLVLFVISTPVFASLALGMMEMQYPPTREYPAAARAIVVLSGSMYAPTDTQPEPLLGESTLHRCLRAATIYFEDPSRLILVIGRTHRSGPSTASLMRQYLQQLGVPAEHVLVEENSRNTSQSAAKAKQLLSELDIGNVLLVSDASHLYRAHRAFERTGLTVAPVGCRYRDAPVPGELAAVLPSPSAAGVVQEVSHELLGIVWYWMRGRL